MGPSRPGPADGPQEGDRTQGPDQDRPRPGLERKPGEPTLPPDVDLRRLDRRVRAELRSLPKELADIVAGHLVLAGDLIDTEPEAAYAHAEAARRRAARLPIVREGAAETAYAAGKYDTALSEYRALRRMTGGTDYLPVMADCERALGRPQQALKLIKEAAGQRLDPAARIELRIVEAGARRDLGQDAEAIRLLRTALADQRRPEPGRPSPDPTPVARLHYALADLLLERGDRTAARTEFGRAAELDADGVTDAQERSDELDGLVIDFDEDADGDDQHQAAPDGDASVNGHRADGTDADAG